MEPNFAASETSGARERNWAPVAIAALMVIAVVAAAWLVSGRARHAADANNSSGAADAYAANLPITNLAMSEASNLVGGKVTYVSGHVANRGGRMVTGILVQVVFRDYKREVAQSQRMPLTVIRMREPYIDTAALSAAPLKAGGEADFRLNFDTISPEWAGAMPELRIVRVDLK
jgi:hypothetical protein